TPDLPRDANPDLRKLEGVASPSGSALSPDESTLFVGDAEGSHVWAFRIEKDGRLTAGERYCPLRVKSGQKASGVTALATDAAGRVYAATPLGVQVFDPTGRLSGVMTHPAPGKPLVGLAFGGPDRKTLYVSTSDTVYARKSKVQGAGFPGPKEKSK